MPNRAERRAQAKNNRRGVPQQYDQTHGRVRSGMLDEYQLQEKSRRLQDGTDGPWKPTGGTIEETESLLTTSPNYTNPKMFKAPHSARQWFRVISWLLIALSAIAFLVIMWLPSHPMWLVATVSIVFAVGVLSLFFTAGNPKHMRVTNDGTIRSWFIDLLTCIFRKDAKLCDTNETIRRFIEKLPYSSDGTTA